MIDLEAARALLDLGRRIGGGPRAEEQLRGAVAIHNILRKHRVAYLADEVGMGKTYVALGALALFRHFEPNFRALVITPRENIQKKWQKELQNFAAHNVRFADMRVASLDGRPTRAMASCGNLIELVHEASLDPNRDFFLRMTSFSLPLGRTSEDWKKMRDALRRHLPWLRDDAFDLRNKDAFKKNFARALCCALPRFDLVIVDEAHNFKHGFGSSASARNQVLAEAFGRHHDGDAPHQRLFPGYGARADRVLFLSATPLEETYRHIWNQLDLFGLGKPFAELKNDDLPEARKKEIAGEFLVRRVTSLRVAGREHTKNMYRREWRAGGVVAHDEPIRVTDERQRLIVALVQKKVSELLTGKKFNRSFQIGMLASFESFLETARLKRDEDDVPVFDDTEQTDVTAEREGVDVRDLNRLARHYRKTFGREMPHPKMDAVVDSLATTWTTGRKSLVFVRRVASVKELKRKLDERYDDWLLPELRGRLPDALHVEIDRLYARYRREKEDALATQRDASAPVDIVDSDLEIEDGGGNDTFFAWFFRGNGPRGVVSGANIQARFIKSSGAYATFFADNHVMDLLGAQPGEVVDALAAALALPRLATIDALRLRAARYISKRAKVVTRASRMEAAQAAALELLMEGTSDLATRAGIVWDERYRASQLRDHAIDAPPEIAHALERATFFTELRRPGRGGLRAAIWPAVLTPGAQPDKYRAQLREQELRAQFLATAARLGHAFIDLYVAAMKARTTLATGRADDSEGEDGDESREGRERLLDDYLDLLEAQHAAPIGSWGALRELQEISDNFDLIIDVNAPDARTAPLGESARYVASLLRQQQPVGGMSGQVNQTLVRQFRMPGYPFVLVTTDLLQEGEDLHTFCSSVQHYGISWTPSAMEQRIGRIDRVRSQTDRKLSGLEREPAGDDWLQVYFPYLEDTVEVLQVERVLDRMNTFLRLMHEGLTPPAKDERKIDVQRELVAARRRVAVVREPLKSAFPLPTWATKGTKATVAVDASVGDQIRERFAAMRGASLGGLPISWVAHPPKGTLLGTAHLAGGRAQPFMLVLRAEHGRPVVRCVSPIGRTDPEADPQRIVDAAARAQSRVGAILTREQRSYDLTVEDDVMLGADAFDLERVGVLVARVVEQADRMERQHFGDERDAKLEAFEADMRKEGGHAD